MSKQNNNNFSLDDDFKCTNTGGSISLSNQLVQHNRLDRDVSQQQDENVGQFDLFNNPQIKRAKESLPPAVRAQYEQIGENIWNQMEASQASLVNNSGEDINFTGENLPPPVEEAAANIAEAIKSGLHPTLLDDDEVNLMKECFGSRWYTHWGYTDEDMKEEI